MTPLEEEQRTFFNKGKPVPKEMIEAYQEQHREAIKEINKPKPRPKCRWCGGDTRPLNSNGICGPGYAEWNYVCIDCGRVQS